MALAATAGEVGVAHNVRVLEESAGELLRAASKVQMLTRFDFRNAVAHF